MKKELIIVLTFITQINFGQNIFPASGNAGIGTSSPSSKLEVIGDDPNVLEIAGFYNSKVYGNVNDKSETRINIGKLEGVIREPMGAVGAFPANNTDSSRGILTFYTRESQSVLERMRINWNGNVGIGTSAPDEKLTVDGNEYITGNLFVGKDTETAMISGLRNGGAIQIKSHSGLGGAQNRYLRLGWKDNGSNFAPVLSINDDLNVGIGTTTPTSKLTVAGNIHSREVKVTVDAGADFVFEKDYNLPSLDSVDNYIKENKHLPEIASAKEMQTNGLNLSEMNIKLLQKVEELTLYVIEQNKKLEMQQNENTIQSKEIIKLKEANDSYKVIAERISKLENQLKN